MTGDELRERIRHLGLSYTAAAPRLGLSLAGLHHNLRDERKITRQTEIILDMLEREQGLRTRRNRPFRLKNRHRSQSLVDPRPRRTDLVEAFAQYFELDAVAQRQPVLGSPNAYRRQRAFLRQRQHQRVAAVEASADVLQGATSTLIADDCRHAWSCPRSRGDDRQPHTRRRGVAPKTAGDPPPQLGHKTQFVILLTVEMAAPEQHAAGRHFDIEPRSDSELLNPQQLRAPVDLAAAPGAGRLITAGVRIASARPPALSAGAPRSPRHQGAG